MRKIQKNQKMKWIAIALLLLSFTVLIPTQSLEEEYLIVSIVDADYPPDVYVATINPVVLFEFNIQVQIENPTQTVIEGSHICYPIPLPQVNTTLKNKNLTVSQDAVFEWVVGTIIISPGKRVITSSLVIIIGPYRNTSLPLGVYEFWFDYVGCGSVPVPVITEKMYVDVTETSVTYYFDYDNESRVVSPITQVEANDYPITFISSFLLLLVMLKSLNRKRNNLNLKEVKHKRD